MQTHPSWKKAIPIIVGMIIFIAIASYIVFQQKTVVGKQDVLAEVERLRAIASSRNLTVDDLVILRHMSAKDEHARDMVDKTAWMAERNLGEHVDHVLYYYVQYVKEGSESICIPHELSHIKLYLEYGEIKRAQDMVPMLEMNLREWKQRVQAIYQRFPQYYPKYTEFITTIDTVIPRLAQHQFDNETNQMLLFIEENEVC